MMMMMMKKKEIASRQNGKRNYDEYKLQRNYVLCGS